ncbi:thioesterase family protein [soil metagenome]
MSSEPASAAFDLPLRVEAADIDEQGHVNNVVYLRWAQEAATAHWQALAPPEAQANTGWVVLRHEIDYKAAAFLHDEVNARTGVGAARGAIFERHTEITRGAARELLAQVRTLWCPIDPETARPKRLSREVRAFFSSARESRE